MHNEEYQVKFYQLCSVVLCIVISSMCINREEKANEFFQNVFTDFVGDFKYLIMLAMLDGAILPLNGKQAKPFH